jgi:hypothetical protein
MQIQILHMIPHMKKMWRKSSKGDGDLDLKSPRKINMISLMKSLRKKNRRMPGAEEEDDEDVSTARYGGGYGGGYMYNRSGYGDC